MLQFSRNITYFPIIPQTILNNSSSLFDDLLYSLIFSAIKGYIQRNLRPATAGSVCELRQVNTESHLIFTAETHNFPTGVAPFSGATTGTGGRIRDVQCVGRGGYCIAGTAGYSVGNLNIPGKKFIFENLHLLHAL